MQEAFENGLGWGWIRVYGSSWDLIWQVPQGSGQAQRKGHGGTHWLPTMTNICSWTLKSSGTHQPTPTLVNDCSPQNKAAAHKPLWGMIPGPYQQLNCIQGLLVTAHIGIGLIFDQEKSWDLPAHGSTFLCPGICWKLQRQTWYANGWRSSTSLAGQEWQWKGLW